MNRRTWIARSGVFYTSLMLGPYLGISTPNHPESYTKIRMNANENPYGCSPKVLKTLIEAEKEANRYAFPSIPKMKSAFAAYADLSEDHVMIGPGSSYLLESVAQFFLQTDGDIISPSVTFDILPAFLERFNRTVHRVPLTEDHGINLDRMVEIARRSPGLIYVVNPNNPIGTMVTPAELKEFIGVVTEHSYVVVDEAYLEFSENPESMTGLVTDNPKLIVLKTMSKIYGMAGLRIGYGFAHPDTVKAIEKHQLFPGVFTTTPSFSAAMTGLEDQEYVTFIKDRNTAAKQLIYDTLDALNIYYISSQANFILFDLSDFRGNFMEEMSSHNILIGTRDYQNKTWCRVSMGTIEETRQFVDVLEQIWKG